MEVTAPHGPEDVVLGDRHDARAAAIRWVVEQHADVIVRFGWKALRLQTDDGEPWSVWDAARQRPDATPGEWEVQLPSTKKESALRVRIVAIRKSPQATAQARRQARLAARQHGHTLSAATLEAADS